MTTEIYDLIYKIINPVCDTYKNHYPSKEQKKYPYCELTFPNILPNNEVSNKTLLQIDVWDNKIDNMTEIETITSNIYNALVDKRIKTDDMFINIVRNSPSIISLQDPDFNIQRRQLRFLITIYKNNMLI